MQATFLKVERALRRGETVVRSEQAWLYTIALRVCIRSTDARSRVRMHEVPSDLDLIGETVPANIPPEDAIIDVMWLEVALDELPERQRRALVLRDFLGASYRQIERELEMSKGAVEMMIFRGRRSLAQAERKAA